MHHSTQHATIRRKHPSPLSRSQFKQTITLFVNEIDQLQKLFKPQCTRCQIFISPCPLPLTHFAAPNTARARNYSHARLERAPRTLNFTPIGARCARIDQLYLIILLQVRRWDHITAQKAYSLPQAPPPECTKSYKHRRQNLQHWTETLLRL